MKTAPLFVTALVTCTMLAGVVLVTAQAGEYSVACSADGNKIVTAFYPGGISNSTDAGATWNSNNVPVANWCADASSADGTILAAAIDGGGSYTSTNSGARWWTNGLPPQHWRALASSQDGTRLVAGAYLFGPIYTSTNAGLSWTSNNVPNLWWNSIASSADGLKLAAAAGADGGSLAGIYTSSDGGATWTLNSVGSTNTYWYGIASSADGTRLVAVAYSGGIYISTNSGTNWSQTDAPVAEWANVASSADGSKLAATSVAAIYISTNSGNTWAPIVVGEGDWFWIASSADGNILATVNEQTDSILVTKFTPTPCLNIATSNGNVVLSWIVPSINLVLQQSPNLPTTRWANMAYALTLTNLQYQTWVSPASGNMFFRLTSQ